MRRSSGFLALTLAGTGVLLAGAIVWGLSLEEVLVAHGLSVGVGLAALAAFSFGAAGALAPVAARGKVGLLVGAAFGLGSLILAVTAGAATNLLVFADLTGGAGEALFDWVVKPLFWVVLVGAVPALSLGGLFAFLVRRQVPPRASRWITGLAVATLLLPGAVVGLGFGRHESVTHPMRWHLDDEVDRAAGRITLVFLEHPHHFQIVESPELLAHLEAHPDRTVPVTYELTRDLGRLRGIGLVSIGDWPGGSTGWQGGGQGCGAPLGPCGSETGSPW